MALLTVQDNGGLVFSAADTLGDSFVNNVKRKILFKNEDASAKTVTITAQNECSQGFLHDITIAVPAGETFLQDTIESKYYNDENSKIQMTYSDVTALSVAIISF